MTVDAVQAPSKPLTNKVSSSQRVKRGLSGVWGSVFVIAITVLWTLPTLGLFVTSFRVQEAVTETGWWTVITHPNFTLDNYSTVLFNGGYNVQGGLMPYFINSLVISIPATLIPLAIAAMAAYALAWVPFRGATFLFFLIFALQVVPLQMALVPLLTLFNKGVSIGGTQVIPSPHLSGTFYTVWISHTMFSLPLAIFLLHNFIAQLPKEVIESAKVDGANFFVTFRRIVLPLTVPAIASFAIFQFLWVWNDLLVSLTFLGGSPNVFPITARISQLTGSLGSRWDLLAPAAFVAIIVPLVVFFSLQRFFVRGLLAGSVKG